MPVISHHLSFKLNSSTGKSSSSPCPLVHRHRLIHRSPCTRIKSRSTDDITENHPNVHQPNPTCHRHHCSTPTTSSNQLNTSTSTPSTDFLSSILRSSPYDAAIFSLAVPAVLALAADPLLAVVDTVFVGQMGSDALAALGINSALFTFSFVVFNFLSTATTPLIASALATGDEKKAGKITLQALGVASVLGIGLAGALIVGADQALALMGADSSAEPEVFHLAKQFLLIRACAAPAALLTTVGQGAFRGLQDMKTPLTITLGANAINLSLDILLILGLGWGIEGAATATATAEWIAAIAYLGVLYQRRSHLGGLDVAQLLPSRHASENDDSFFSELLPFFTAGGSVLMRTALLLGTKTLASATAARLGTVEVASHQVVMQLWLLSSLLIDSLAVAGQSLVAVEKGKGDDVAARSVSDRLLGLGVGAGALLAGFFWISEPIVPRIFTNDTAVIDTVKNILPLAVAMLPINAAVYVLDGCFVGAKDFGWLAGAMGVAAAMGTGLLLSVHPLNLGLEGVWGALAVLMIGRLATLMFRYQSREGPLPPPLSLAVHNTSSSTVLSPSSSSSSSTSASTTIVSISSSSSSMHSSIDDDRSAMMVAIIAEDRDSTASGMMSGRWDE